MKFGSIVPQENGYPSIDGIGLMIWCHYFKMAAAAGTSFHA